VDDGSAIDVDAFTTFVEVLVETTNEDAIYEISGDTDLDFGENTLVVTVTAGDGTSETYTVIVNVLFNNDTSLSLFTVNGIDVEDGATVNLAPLTTDVEVLIETTDPDATYEIDGDSDLQTLENTLTVTVTAADETTLEYTVTLFVPLNNDTSLTGVTIDGLAVEVGDSVDLAPLTDSVIVDVETTDIDASFEVEGDSELVVGENTLTVIVTAADGETISEYEFTLNVAPNDDSFLSVFKINGIDVTDGDSIDLEALTSEVEIEVETSDPDATYEVSGGTDLVAGESLVTVTVTAADGSSTDYVVTLNVLYNDDTSIAVLQINGEDAEPNAVVEIAPLTTEVDVVVETTDPEAFFEITGDKDLLAGENTLTITVTAADLETVEEFEIILNVLLNNDSSLAVFQVNGEQVEDGSVVELDPLTTEVEVLVETTDPDATYEISGDTELQTRENTLVVTVTAADGTAVEYTITLNVAPNNDANVNNISINGVTVVDGEEIELEAGTETVDVEVEASDPEATIEISGNEGLVIGENTLTVIVTAVDEETIAEYVFTLFVLDNTNVTLSTFTVDGEPVEDGAQVNLAPLTTEVSVFVETTDLNATFEVTGGTDLVVGDNELLVAVTAADGETTAEYTVTLTVLPNTDASADVTVNGEAAVDGSVFTYLWDVTSVVVEVVTGDVDATVSVEGGADLEVGANDLVVSVTAADGETVNTFTITLNRLANADTSLAVFQVNGADVLSGDVVELDAGTTAVEVVAEATDSDAAVEIVGNEELVAGDNDLVVSVVAADGESVFEHLVTLRVAFSLNTDLAAFSVNGTDVAYGDSVDLETGTTDVEVVVETADPRATFVVEGDSGLVAGENFLVVTVTAEDEVTTSEYVVILNVLLGTDTTTAVFQVDGNDVSDGDVVELAEETTEVDVTVETTDADASFEIFGADELVVGENVLTVSVTAADGETFADFQVILVVPQSTNTELETFTINGSDVVDGDTFETDSGVSSVEVVVETLKPEATFEIFGGSNLIVGENELKVTVTAADGTTTTDYTVIIFVPSSDSTAKISVDGLETISGDVVTVEKETASVEVSVETSNEFATVLVAGNEDLVEGDNIVTVTVTAQDGSTSQYIFTVRVGGASADTALTTLTLNDADVVDGQTVQLRSRTTSVNVVAVPRDPAASVKITGRTGLVVGSNDVVVTVTAPDLKTIRVITIKAVVAPLSTNTNLSTFTVNGLVASDNATLGLPPLTRVVTVVATPEDAESVVVISGRSGLVDGNNTLTAIVTSASGAVKTYTVTLNVRPISNDVTLSTFTVNGSAPVNNLVEVPAGTTTVPVVATPTASTSTASISGNTGLRVGDNFITVLVTAESGATRTYRVTVKVPLSDNTALKTLQVNGVDAAPDSTVNLARGTTAVAVKVATADAGAQFQVSGSSALVTGANTLTVKVTAANGTTVTEYKVTLFVALPSANTGLSSIKVNGSTVVESGTITVPALTTSVAVETQTSDPEASASVLGRTGLIGGDNTVSIVVSAANGDKKTYTVTVRVLVLSSDSTVKSISVNQSAYVSGFVEVPFGTRSVDVVAVTNDSAATYGVVGNGALKTGDNTVVVRVTAANGSTRDYSVAVRVLKSANTDLAVLSVNNQNALLSSTITVPARTNVALVKAVTADADATVAVSGTALVAGQNNTVSVVVTAANGTTSRTYSVTVLVTALSSDSTLKSLRANNEAYTVGSQVELPIGSKSIPVVAVANDAGASVEVTGNTNLSAALNNVRVRVTAANGSFTDYTVKVFVASRSTNAAISTVAGSWTINGVDVAVEGTVVELAAGRSAVSASAKPADSKATIAVTGTTGLKAGDNTVTFTVTAEDGTTSASYTRTVRVAALSSNTNITSLTVADVSTAADATVNVPFGTTRVSVIPVLESAEAKFTISGNSELETGANEVVVTVTAPSGAVVATRINVQVAEPESNTGLSTFTINDEAVLDNGSISVSAGVTRVRVSAIAADAKASVEVTGKSGLRTGENTLTVKVTALSGASKTYTVTVNVGN